MEMTEKKNDLKSMMVESMEKVKEMVDANNIVGEPITTPDGVTLIPISRLSYGFGCGGGDYGKNKENSGAGCGAVYFTAEAAKEHAKAGGQGRRDPYAAGGCAGHHHRGPGHRDGAGAAGPCRGLRG